MIYRFLQTVGHDLALARRDFQSKRLFKSKERDILLAATAYGVENCLRALSTLCAQGTEAQRAETENTGSVHDGPVGEADAPQGRSND